MAQRVAFVTGATGFVGQNLTRLLAEAGWRIVALKRPTSDTRPLKPYSVRFVDGSLTDPTSLLQAMPESVDAVFHLAGDVRLYRRRDAEQTALNVDGSRNVARAALSRGAKRFIHTSSFSAFGLHRERITEETTSNALDVPINYFRSKKLGEIEVEKAIADGLDAVIMCPTNILGPHDTRHWARMVCMVHSGTLPGVGPGRASFCHVREVARAHIAAVDKGRTGERYLLAGADATYLELAKAMCMEIGGRTPRHAMPAPLFLALGYLLQWAAEIRGRSPMLTPEIARSLCATLLADSSKAERELGYRPVSLQQMVADECQWLRENGFLEGVVAT